jgi:antitoxin component of RelBE/YafQ-DinJ toxin-antitoxin module
MSTTTTFLVKTDKELKKAAQAAAKELGISLTTVVNDAFKRLATERKITLEAEPEIRPEKIAEWNRISRAMDQGKEIAFVANSPEELSTYLKSL